MVLEEVMVAPCEVCPPQQKWIFKMILHAWTKALRLGFCQVSTRVKLRSFFC